MQPPAVSKGSRCTCLSVFYQLCSLANGGGMIQEQRNRMKLKYTDINIKITE